MLSTSKSFFRKPGGGAAPTTDASFAYVPLLTETGSVSVAATTVADGAQTPNTVTRNGGVPTGWTSPYQTDGYWSNQFNGSTDYFTLPASAALTLTANFTIEFWVYSGAFASGASNPSLFNTSAASIFYESNGSNRGLCLFVGSAIITTATTVLPNNQWNHVVCVRSGSTVSMFVNGSRVGTNASFSSTADFSSAFVNRYFGSAAGYLNGYMSNLRVVKGAAVYDPTLTTLTVPTAPLTPTTGGTNPPTGTQTSLLTCQSNRFIDNSASPLTLTLAGTPSVQSGYYPFAAPTASPGAALFNGTNQYLNSTTASTVFQFGSNPYTIEGWVYQTARPSTQFICGGQFSGAGCQININSSGFVSIGVPGVGDLTASTIAIPLNAWTHFAFVRSSTSAGGFTYYINGVAAGTPTDANNYSGTATALNIATTNSSTLYIINGYLGNFRIVKGTAVYTGAFTPPTGPVTQTGGTYPSTTNVNTSIPAANTSLLLNLADSNYTSASSGGTNNTFIDDSTNAFTITRNGTPTQGSRTPYWPNGQWSNYFAGSQSISAPASSSFQFAGDFTIECWIFRTDTGDSSAYVQLGSTIYFALNVQPGTGFNIYLNSATPTISPTDIVPALNVWNHVALVRSGSGSSNVKVYLNGVASTSTATNTSTLGFNVTAYIGALGTQSGGSTVGYISNFRIASSAVYTSNFTPPTTPLGVTSGGQNPPTGTQTKLLTCQSNRFLDNSAVPFTITANGTPSVQAFQPFSPAAAYSAATYAGSGYFNGSTDYLTAAYNSSFVFGTNDFTVECWIYLTSNPTLRGIFSLGYGANGSGPVTSTWQLRYWGTDGSNQISLSRYDGSTSTDYITSGAPIVVNNWYHIAVSRTGGTLKIFVNGISYYSGANTFNFTAVSTSEPFQIGLSYYGPQAGLGGPRYFPGYISNARIINGTGVYSSNFPPPTTPVTNTAQTSLLLNFTNAGIYDAATQNNITTVGDAQASTTITPKWPPSSMKFDGTGDGLTMPLTPATTITSGNFTIEFWLNPSTVATSLQAIVGTREGDGSGDINWGIGLITNQLSFQAYNTSNTLIGTVTHQTTLSAGTWYYCALTRSGSTFTLYVNSVASTSTATSSSTIQQSGTTLRVGRFGAASVYSALNGYIQDLRITKGVARTITTPTAAFPTR